MANKTLTAPQFVILREGIAGAQLFIERVNPALRRAHVMFDKDTRRIIPAAKQAIGSAYNLLRELTGEDDPRDPIARGPEADVQPEIDLPFMRTELDNCAALNLQDLAYEICVAFNEMEQLNALVEPLASPRLELARLCASVWEAGRRYGITEAIALFDATSQEYIDQVDSILAQARDRNLTVNVPAAEPEAGPQLVTAHQPLTVDEGASEPPAPGTTVN